MLNRVTYSHALRAPKPWPPSPLSVTAAAISTPTTLSTKTINSVVLNADLVSAVLNSDLASAVRRGASAPALYVGAFVVGSVVVIGELPIWLEMRRAIKPFPRPGESVHHTGSYACMLKRIYLVKLTVSGRRCRIPGW